MTRMIALVTLLGCLIMETPGLAADPADLARENADLQQRVDRLEKQVQQMQTDGKAVSPTLPAEQKKSLWSTLDIELYGYIKADAAWDDSRVTTGDYVLFADRGGEDDHEFNLTARQTRLGLKIKGPDLGEIQTSGLVEGDFYGMGGTENKPVFRMRHAYMKLLWPEDRFSILAGQTWDVIAPLWPDTLNFTILWDAGNIGYRHPQIRLTKEIPLREDMQLELAGALSRTVSEIEEAAGSGRPGEAAGVPTLQGRVGLTFPVVPIKPTTVGVSGHWGEEEYAGNNDVDSWSVNLDVLQPVNKSLTIKGEAFVGENLDDYFGGIGQGVRNPLTTAYKAIGSRGGWIQASLTPYEKWRFNLGAGIDDVDRDDVSTNGRTLNRSIYGNAIYAINKSTDVGLEVSQWRTDYKGADDVDDVRVQASFIYKF